MREKPKILVVGATGFIGAHITRRLRERGYPVCAGRRSNSETWHLEDVEVEWVYADLEEPESIRDALEDCAGVIHAAGYYPRDGLDIDTARRRGVRQLRNLLDACMEQRVARVVYVSSPVTLGVGDGEESVLDEDDYYVPGTVRNAYYETKYTMEAEIYRYVRQGLPAVVTIPSAVLGPGDLNPANGHFLLRLARGKMPAIIGHAINVVDVRDTARSIVAALERGRPGRRYVLGGENTSVDGLVELISEIASVDRPRFHLPTTAVRRLAWLAERLGRRAGFDPPPMVVGVDLIAFARRISSERAINELGHQSRPLHETIADALAWFEAHEYLQAGLMRSARKS